MECWDWGPPTIDPNVLEYTIYFSLHEVTELVNKRSDLGDHCQSFQPLMTMLSPTSIPLLDFTTTMANPLLFPWSTRRNLYIIVRGLEASSHIHEMRYTRTCEIGRGFHKCFALAARLTIIQWNKVIVFKPQARNSNPDSSKREVCRLPSSFEECLEEVDQISKRSRQVVGCRIPHLERVIDWKVHR